MSTDDPDRTVQRDPEPDNATLVRSPEEQARAASAAAPWVAIPGYEIECELKRGGMGVVYRARQAGLNRTVALKMILAGAYADPATRTRFLLEAESVAALEHPHVVKVFAFGEHAGHPFLAMEFLPGGTLADRVTAGGPLPAREATEHVAKLAEAVAHAHSRGVVHRDIKPANVLLTADGEPRLADFGLAKVGRSDLTGTGKALGTPSYMSPEQAAGKTHEVGTPADVYALGAVMYDLLTGRPPFRGDSVAVTLQKVISEEPERPRKLNASIPRDLETICLKCLEKEQGKRYPTAQSLADDLHRFLRGEPISVRPAGPLERGYKWVKRNKVVSGLTSAIVLSLVVGTAVSARYAISYYRSADDLKNALHKEEIATADLRDSLALAQRREGLLAVEKGMSLCERGEERHGLLWFARGSALLHSTNADELDQRYARMNLSLWGQKLDRPDIAYAVGNGRQHAELLPDRKSLLLRLPEGPWARVSTNRDTRLHTYAEPTLTPKAAKIASRPELAERVTNVFAGRPFAIAENGTMFGTTFDWNAKDEAKSLPGPALSVMAVWDIETGALVSSVERLAGDTGWAVQFSPLWSPNLRYAITLEESNGGVQLWDVRRGQIIAAIHPRRDDEAGAFLLAAFSPDERRVLTASPKRIAVWDCTTGARVAEFICEKPPRSDCILFSPDGEVVVCACGAADEISQTDIYRWNAQTGQQIGSVLKWSSANRTFQARLRFTLDGRQLIADDSLPENFRLGGGGLQHDDMERNKNWTFQAWEWPSGRPWAHPDIHPQGISPDKRFAVGQSGEWVEWPTARLLGRRAKEERPVGFSPVGDVVLTHGFGLYRCRDALSARLIGPRYEGSLAQSGGRGFIGAFGIVEPLAAPTGEIVFSTYHVIEPGIPSKENIRVTTVRLAPVAGSPERVTLWAQIVAGMELNEDGTLRTLSPAELADRKRLLNEHGGDPLPK